MLFRLAILSCFVLSLLTACDQFCLVQEQCSDTGAPPPEAIRDVREFDVHGVAFVRDRFVVPIIGENDNAPTEDRRVTLHHVPTRGPLPVLDETATGSQHIDVYNRARPPFEVVGQVELHLAYGDNAFLMVGDARGSVFAARIAPDTTDLYVDFIASKLYLE